MAQNLGLPEVPEQFRAHVDAALARRDQVVGDLLQGVGGGELGPLVHAYLDDGALCWALSRLWAARGAAGDLDASREARALTVAARGHWTMARDTAAKDAEARPARAVDVPWITRGTK